MKGPFLPYVTYCIEASIGSLTLRKILFEGRKRTQTLLSVKGRKGIYIGVLRP